MFLAVFLFAIWSFTFLLGKGMVGISSPLFLTALRMLVAGLLLCGYLFLRDRKALSLSSRGWLSILWLALTSVLISNVLELWGLRAISATKTCFIYSLSPFFTAFLSYCHFKELMTPRRWFGLLLSFIGVLPPLFFDRSTQTLDLSLLYGFSWAELAVVGATFFAVWGWVLLRVTVKDEKIAPLAANGLSMLLGGTLALLASFALEAPMSLALSSTNTAKLLIGTFLTIVISNLFGYNLYGYLLKRYSATLLSLFGLLSPVFVSCYEWLFWGTPPSPLIIGCTGVILTGLLLVYREEKKLGYTS